MGMENSDLKGIVFDISTYSVYDGPGIRTTIFLKGCPLKCSWCHNPESQLLKAQVSYINEKCILCGTCVKSCPEKALEIKKDYIVVNFLKCSLCGECVENCPQGALELIGKERTVQEVLSEVLPDKPFFENSDGGVTISGGEPTLQFKFLIALLKAFQKNNIHTALETCGYFKPEYLDELIAHVDLFLYDLKHPDSKKHEKYTHVPNERILANFKYIVKHAGSSHILVRIPLIPTVNISLSEMKKQIAFLQKIGYGGPVHLMPYNSLAKTKYEKIGMGEKFQIMGELSEETISTIVNLLQDSGYEAVVNH
jgi:pyruvate formate lyase activating enzyme